MEKVFSKCEACSSSPHQPPSRLAAQEHGAPCTVSLSPSPEPFPGLAANLA